MKSILLMNLLLATACLYGQSFSDKIVKEASFEKKSIDNTVIISNINGDIKIEGYSGDKVVVEVSESIVAKTESRLEKAKQEVQLGFIDRADTLIFYIKDGCNSFGKNHRKGKTGETSWGYNGNCNDGSCDLDYDYKMDFVVKVPKGVNVIAATINDGDVSVQKIEGVVNASNINGAIRLSDLVREARAHTINGDVDVTYTQNPSKDCRFYTLNGDINALFKKGLAADVSFESFNGEFFTNVDNIEPLPAKIEKTSDRDGVKFKIDGNRYRVGSGGALLDFETFNGNVYMKEL